MKAGVIGASGYAGVELLRLCAAHPDIEVAVATAATAAGDAVRTHTPSLAASYPGLVFEPYERDRLEGLDVVFFALPHGRSQQLVPELQGRVRLIVDLAADFRLHDPGLYPRWYGEEHAAPELLARAAYGLPELFRDTLVDADLVAAPGCYPTAAALALTPLVRAGVIEPSGVIVDAASGMSGAGRAATGRLHFGEVDENFVAYGLLDHRHTPEIEQATGAEVLFTPHLAPMVRGILATCYARPSALGAGLSGHDVLGMLRDAYAGEPFVVVTDEPPATKSVSGSNSAHISARVDGRTGWIVVLCAIDNLVKGASGQAVQCANVILGLPEATGLPVAGLYP